MSKQERTLALAGVFQAAELVYQIAHHNSVIDAPYQATLASILKLEADSTAAVYGGLGGVKTGLTLLATQMNRNYPQRNWEMLRYGIELLFLERRLHKTPDLLAEVGQRVGILVKQKAAVDDPATVAALADIYVQTLGTFKHRIHVHGNSDYLRERDNVHRIRALLLGGIRSAVLWQQKGGNRLTLMLQRGSYADTAWALLEDCA